MKLTEMSLILINSDIVDLQLKIEKRIQQQAPELLKRYDFQNVSTESAFIERLPSAKIVIGVC
jgi:hypothetical protein